MKKLAWILSTAVSLAATSACAPVEDTAVEEEALGSASVALSAIGPDGHRYRLFSGTSFVVSTEDGNPAFTVPLSESLERQSFDLEVGTYAARLEGPRDGDGDFFLIRETVDGSHLSIVPGRQVSPDPLPFVIRPGQTTQLTFRFSVPQLGDVVFSAGSVDVGIDVENDPVPSHGQSFHVSSNMTIDQVFADVATVPGLQTLVDGAAVGEAPAAQLGLTRTSDWRFSPQGFCADVELGSTGALTVEPEFNALLVQGLSATGSFCFMSESAGGLMLINLRRDGEPRIYEPSFGLPDPISIQIEGYGTPSESLVEGGVLHLSALDEPFEVGSAGLSILVSSGTTNLVTLTLSGAFTLSAQL
jgi:hypothetical protein